MWKRPGFGRRSAERFPVNRRRRAAFSPRFAARRWLGPISILAALLMLVARSTCDTLSPRHQTYQQRHQAHPIGGAHDLDDGGDRHGIVDGAAFSGADDVPSPTLKAGARPAVTQGRNP